MSDTLRLATIKAIRYFKEINAMTRRYLKILLVGSLFTLSACAQQTEVRQMKQSVNTLNTAMDKTEQRNGENHPAKRAERQIQQRGLSPAGSEYACASQ